MRHEQIIQPEEARRLASMKGPKPAESAPVRKAELPPSGRELLAQTYLVLARQGESGANAALVNLIEQARTDCLGARGMPKDIPPAEALTDKLRYAVRQLAKTLRDPAEFYAAALDLVTDEIRGRRVKKAA